MSDNDLALVAHLMRRAGFGATRSELDEYVARGYDTVVEDLLHPERCPDIDEDILRRYYTNLCVWEPHQVRIGAWIYRMINTRRQLQEKMALFWHHVFATGFHKSEHPPSSGSQIETFRRNGLSDMRNILLDLSRDPAMIDWLDNHENHKDEINENYGRELLELFSMGVGNYTEDDIKEAARAFTGWTFRQPIPLYVNGHHPADFVYRPDDHDDSVKTFLGETGRFNGDDIVGIISRQPATARFISRHLYNFFVADEPQVPAWQTVPPQDPDAIETLVKAYFDSGGEMRSVLRVLLSSDFFKEALYKRVKSPTELVVGTVKLTGAHRFPEPGLVDLVTATAAMGQFLCNPPTVEGWHTGKEWIDAGTLNERVNFAADEMANLDRPGIREIIDAIGVEGKALEPEDLVNRCLDQMASMAVGHETRAALIAHARSRPELRFGTEAEREESASRISRMLQLIVSSTEYQYA